MRDIKIKKIHKEKTGHVTEISANSFHANDQKFPNKSYFTKVILSLSIVSVFCYIFLVSSTVYYAVKQQKTISALNLIHSSYNFSSETENFELNNLSKKNISYINKNSVTSVSLK